METILCTVYGAARIRASAPPDAAAPSQLGTMVMTPTKQRDAQQVWEPAMVISRRGAEFSAVVFPSNARVVAMARATGTDFQGRLGRTASFTR